MCGLVGKLSKKPLSHTDKLLLQSLGKIQQHRGPDQSGIYHDGPLAIAHHRLSIIDLSEHGLQPMSTRCGNITLAFSGAIYNYLELKKKYLTTDRFLFRSQTDTEVLLYLYQTIGEKFVHELNGMYSIAIWNKLTNKLFLARDPFGTKPLFYTITSDAFWFSTEISSLQKIPNLKIAPNLQALYHYLSLNYIPGNLTAFDNIIELRAGHQLTIDPSKLSPQIRPFFKINYTLNTNTNKSQMVAKTRSLLEDAVSINLRADVPIGIMLSGGMDSSTLTALAVKLLPDDYHLNTFSIKYEERSFDESRYAREVSDKFKTNHHEILITPQKVQEVLFQFISSMNEPFADGSAIPTYLLSKYAKNYVKVLLSGEGGDEFFAGYDTYAAFKLKKLYQMIPSFLRTNCLKPLGTLLPVNFEKLSLDYKIKRFMYGAEGASTPISHFRWREVFSDNAKELILKSPKVFENLPPTHQLFCDAYMECNSHDELDKLMYIDQKYHLADDLMCKNDRMTMAHSLETRIPFTDIRLVKYLATVSSNYKMKGFKRKYLLKESMSNTLPRNILNKKKVGLELPYSIWLRSHLKDMGHEILSQKVLERTNLFNYKAVKLIWDQHQLKQKDNGRQLWGIIMYICWYHQHIQKVL
ncbi:MAG: asparagine synthase (glutamine-hydrolyzing) [Bacteriovoracaceae bacterium]|nr:asparagine synthase (glutamine-hydrolyzing) [Bacteriovoracaceae bacterium]